MSVHLFYVDRGDDEDKKNNDVPEDLLNFSLDFLRAFDGDPFLALVAFTLEDLRFLVLKRSGLLG